MPVRCFGARCGLAASGSIYSGSLRRSGRNASSSVLAGAAVALTGATSRQPGRVAAGALAADSTPTVANKVGRKKPQSCKIKQGGK